MYDTFFIPKHLRHERYWARTETWLESGSPELQYRIGRLMNRGRCRFTNFLGLGAYLRLLVLLVRGVLHAGLPCTADPVTYLDSQSCRYCCQSVQRFHFCIRTAGMAAGSTRSYRILRI
jgi:hypothetical protein